MKIGKKKKNLCSIYRGKKCERKKKTRGGEGSNSHMIVGKREGGGEGVFQR